MLLLLLSLQNTLRISRICRSLHLLHLRPLLRLNHLLLGRHLGFILGLLVCRTFLLFTVAFFPVVFIEPLDERAEQRLDFFLDLTLVEDAIFVKLLLATVPVLVDAIGVKRLLVQQLKDVDDVLLLVFVPVEVEH